LQCLTVAIQPLTVNELAEVLAIDFPEAGGIPKLKEGCRWEDQEQAVLSACSSLISIVQDWRSRRVQFSHFSVKEFLTSDRLTDSTTSCFFHISPEPAHTVMAQACLGVLLRIDANMDAKTVRSYPLAEYAGEYFTDHADFGNVLHQIDNGLDDLFDRNKLHFEAWYLLNGNIDISELDDSPMTISLSTLSSDSTKSSSNLGHSSANSDQSMTDPPLIKHSLLGLTPLHCILRLQCLSLAQYLIPKRPQDLQVQCKGLTPWHVGMSVGDVKIAHLVLELCPDVHAKAIQGWTLLHVAAWAGHVEPTRMLLERHAAIEARDYKGRTPLYGAAYNAYSLNDEQRSIRCILLLLGHGANVGAQDNRGLTPLHVASYRASDGIVQLLLEHGASINLRNSQGETALHRASRRHRVPGNSVDITRLLIDHDADMDAQDNKGSTPLHLAIFSGNYETAQLLLERGANVDVQNKESSTPLHLAASRWDREVVKLLLDRDANIHVQNNKGQTPLQVASPLVRGLLSEHMQSVQEAH